MRKPKPLAVRKASLGDAISEAFSEFTSLAEEMRAWEENIQEKFSETGKYADVSDAADALEALDGVVDEGAIHEKLTSVEVEWQDMPQRKRGYSRADRCSHACMILDQCVFALDEITESKEMESDAEIIDAAETLKDEIQQARDDAEAITFPGMFG